MASRFEARIKFKNIADIGTIGMLLLVSDFMNHVLYNRIDR